MVNAPDKKLAIKKVAPVTNYWQISAFILMGVILSLVFLIAYQNNLETYKAGNLEFKKSTIVSLTDKVDPVQICDRTNSCVIFKKL